MKLIKISIKVIYLSLVLIIQGSLGQAIECPSNEAKPLLCTSHTVKERTLRECITPNLELWDLEKLREHYTKEFAQRAYEYGSSPHSLGLLAIINLSSFDLKILHYKVPAKTSSIFPRGYHKHNNVETIPLLRKNTVFINLHKCWDKNGEGLYFISQEALSTYSPMISCNVIVFGEYDSDDEQLVIDGIMRYKRYAEGTKDLLDIRNKKRIFFYLDTILT